MWINLDIDEMPTVQMEEFPTIRINNTDVMRQLCTGCNRELVEYPGDVYWAEGTPEPVECDESEDEKHHPYVPTLDWFNSVRVSANTQDDALRVEITMGTNQVPFNFLIRRLGDKYILNTPELIEPGRSVILHPMEGRTGASEFDVKED